MDVDVCKEVLMIGGTVVTGLSTASVALWKALTRCQESKDKSLDRLHVFADDLLRKIGGP